MDRCKSGGLSVMNPNQPPGSTAAKFAAWMFLSASAVSLPAQGGLPPVPEPLGNRITPEKVILGKALFWDEQLSANNRLSCGSCHLPEFGGGDPVRMRNPGPDGVAMTADDTFGSPGMVRADANNNYYPSPVFGLRRQVTRRAAPTNIGAMWLSEMFWDGRATDDFVDPETGRLSLPMTASLESQAVGPPLSPAEMAHDFRQWGEILNKLARVKPLALATELPPDLAATMQSIPDYAAMFAAAFGDPAITVERIAFSIASYERTLVPDQSPWDLHQAGVSGALTPKQLRGLQVFEGPGRCATCHPVGQFTDGSFRNLGLRPISEDDGRQTVTRDPMDRGRFKVPTLRNVGLRQSFMHTGEFQTLSQVIAFYQQGGGLHLDNKDPALQPLQLTPLQTTDLIAFVGTALTDPRVAARQFPFDRPKLLSERMPAEGWLFGQGTMGSGNLVPRMLAEMPPNIGNFDFRLGVGDALGGSFAALLLSSRTAPRGWRIGGTSVLVDTLVAMPFLRHLSGPAVPGAGYATIKLPVPNAPALAGFVLFGQWFVFEPALTTIAASSRAVALPLF